MVERPPPADGDDLGPICRARSYEPCAKAPHPIASSRGLTGCIMPTKDEEAVALAQTHYQVEEGLTHVFRLIGDGRG